VIYVSGLLELCLDLNQTPAIHPDLRFNVSYPEHQVHPALEHIPKYFTPEGANEYFNEVTAAVRNGQMPHVDLAVIREHIDDRLAAQGVELLSEMESAIPQPLPSTADAAPMVSTSDDGEEMEPVGWLTGEQEDAYLTRLDGKLSPDGLHSTQAQRAKEREAASKEEKHWAELTPRELERQVELLNPQSQHNWLKTHTKVLTNLGGDDDAESIAGDGGAGVGAPKSSRRKSGKDKNLAKQVGDRAVERAREGWSPSAASAGLDDEDELAVDGGSTARKRTRDPDGTYRVKGGKSGTAGNKGKRKRSGDDFGGPSTPGGATSIKKPKVEGE
jgi:hypothetical protein